MKIPILFGEWEALHAIRHIQFLRKKDIPSELYPDSVKLSKQLKYANKRGFYIIAIVGEKEIEKGIIKIKNLRTINFSRCRPGQ
ncbi:His/Gly/Thr/Pro-type tRNA ligase C-terminal domain-containing protein [Candidatus Walczuchella monophlebidarum]|uniref:His/Gly/Thr/Pro-type tRNA ligase C-terminal domain-containing protein n=1 Tax=Candidatus Walczuchella monophlebidarum TaxID=1415657 RepID=UPI0006894724|nr:His/Gly/Thr/Pro-type tRNA ligase C-terminal domain-containing protein [Candidatus Walczuchella monophlebidarum]